MMDRDPAWESVKRVLLEKWDPLFIYGSVAIHDEYDGLVSTIKSAVSDYSSSEEIETLLRTIEIEDMHNDRPDEDRIVETAKELFRILK